jgi:NADH-quinone oxidoreductase subunit N
MFIDEPVSDAVVRPKITYQIMLGAFSAALILFGLWWTPIITWTSKSLTFLQRG